MNKLTLRMLPALLLAVFSGAASAAAFQLWEQNASGLGTAYAGSAAVADNASTIFYNPAGMSELAGYQVSVGDVVSFYADIVRVGTTSITVRVEVYAERNYAAPIIVRVTEAELTYVAIDGDGRKRQIPPEN